MAGLLLSISIPYHAFDFAKYVSRYVAAFVYRFNRRFQFDTLPMRLLVAAIEIGSLAHAQTPGFDQLKHLANQQDY